MIEIDTKETKRMRRSYWFNPNNPLWLPPGTVRAIIVLAFAAAVVIPLLKFAAYREEIPQTVKEVVLFMAGSLYPLIAKYMEVRAKEQPTRSEEVPPAGGQP